VKPLEFTFDDAEHIYTLKNGVEVPGCTRVIDTGGWDTYANVRQDILDRKSEIGREVHRATVMSDHGTLDWDSLDPRVEGYVRSWRYFRETTGFVPILSEFRSVCEVHERRFGLTIDCFGKTGLRGFKRGGIETIVEKKCTVAKARRHALQTAGYAIGFPLGYTTAMGRFLSRRRLVVYLKPNGVPDIDECDQREDYEIFMALLTVTEYKLREMKIERETPCEVAKRLLKVPAARI
jgi:hypothetical protein